MNTRDEKVRSALTDSLTHSSVDIRNLVVEVLNSSLIVKGSVPSEDSGQLDLLVKHCVSQGLSLEHSMSRCSLLHPLIASTDADALR